MSGGSAASFSAKATEQATSLSWRFVGEKSETRRARLCPILSPSNARRIAGVHSGILHVRNGSRVNCPSVTGTISPRFASAVTYLYSFSLLSVPLTFFSGLRLGIGNGRRGKNQKRERTLGAVREITVIRRESVCKIKTAKPANQRKPIP